MGYKATKTTIQFRRDTTANWEQNKHIIPATGEPCFDIDTGSLKVGDGVTTYENLSAIGAGAYVGDDGTILIESNTIRLFGFENAKANTLPVKNESGTLEWIKPEFATRLYTYRGVVHSLGDLPASNIAVGDAYNVATADPENGIAAGDSVVWNGAKWDNIGNAIVLSEYATKDELSHKVDMDKDARLITHEEAKALADLIGAAPQPNIIEAVTIGGSELPVIHKSVQIPVAASGVLGVVTSSALENKVFVGEGGVMEVNALNVTKLVQTDGDSLIFDSGTSSHNI